MNMRNPFADEPVAPVSRLQVVGDLSNPYAAPATEGYVVTEPESNWGLWRDGLNLVMHEKALFPPRCLITGDPTVHRNRQLVICMNGLATKTLSVEFSLVYSEKNRIWWRRLFAGLGCMVASGVLVISVASIALALGSSEEAFSVLTCGVMLPCSFLLIYFDIMVGRVLTFGKLERRHIWLHGASPAFLNTLPSWAGFDKGAS